MSSNGRPPRHMPVATRTDVPAGARVRRRRASGQRPRPCASPPRATCTASRRAPHEAARGLRARCAATSTCCCSPATSPPTASPSRPQVLADACRDLDIPIFAVLGQPRLALRPASTSSRRSSRTPASRCSSASARRLRSSGVEVGIVGLKGFVGGFPGSHLPDFGEPLLRERLRRDDRGRRGARRGPARRSPHCPRADRAAALRARSTDTLVGEPETIWTFLGNDRLAAPIAQHEPDLVLHGHAHAGTFEGAIGDVPVYNVSVPVIGATSGSSS